MTDSVDERILKGLGVDIKLMTGDARYSTTGAVTTFSTPRKEPSKIAELLGREYDIARSTSGTFEAGIVGSRVGGLLDYLLHDWEHNEVSLTVDEHPHGAGYSAVWSIGEAPEGHMLEGPPCKFRVTITPVEE